MQQFLSILCAGFVAIAAISCKEKAAGEAVNNDTLTSRAQAVVAKPKPFEVYTNDTVTVNGYKWEGLQHYLNQKNDTTYVINFWATSCEPCVAELPYFEEINEKYKKNKVKVILVSMDFGKDIKPKLLPFINRKQLKSEVIAMRETDVDSWLSKVDSTWTGALPATIIYNKNERKFYEKSFTYAELEKEVSNFK
jgi:thiol-disulfide isomerase/thioredoxin